MKIGAAPQSVALLFASLCLVLVPVILVPVALAEATHGPPNILLIVADDLGWADAGFRGSDIDTPALDRLAKEGVELRRFYTTPLCSPTRASLLTGRDSALLGFAYTALLPWHNHGVHTDEHFMPESFRAAGYQTAIIGKWHLGHSQQSFHPNQRGFDHFYGHLHTEVGYFPPFSNQGGIDFQRNGVTITDEGYETYLLSTEARRWIRRRDKKKPFFLYLPFLAPHSPLEAPADLLAKYRNLPDRRGLSRSQADRTNQFGTLRGAPSQRPVYAAVVESMDRAIGQVLFALDAEGVTKDTLVLFMSDNGGEVVRATSGGDNTPLRGGKGGTYEGGIRVMAMLRWPGQLAPGTQWGSMMTMIDVFPTLASAAGVPMLNKKALDGRDLWAAIRDGEAVPYPDLFIVGAETPIYGSISLAAIGDRWKLVQSIEHGLTSITVVNELFDLRYDPSEYNNVAERQPEVVHIMANAIKYWRSRHPVSSARIQIMAPPGWHAPRDWADYPQPLETLQDSPAPGMPPPQAVRLLDYLHGERGRLIYDCDPWLLAGGLCRP